MFSLSGKSKNQIPCFPCAVATLYYAMYCTHYTRTRTGTGKHCFLLCPYSSLPRSREVCMSHKLVNQYGQDLIFGRSPGTRAITLKYAQLNDGFGNFFCSFCELSFTNPLPCAIVIPCYCLTIARDDNSTGPVVCTPVSKCTYAPISKHQNLTNFKNMACDISNERAR